MDYCFAPVPVPSVPIIDETGRFPLRRIFCIGRNYADHAREMGDTTQRKQPVFFRKPADSIVVDGSEVRYPPATSDLHHEVEMTVALASGGRNIAANDALACVFGYGVGLDLTRRDLQLAAKAAGLPWDMAKGFDDAAPLSALRRASDCGHPRDARLTLQVNGELRQSGNLADMLWPVPEIIAELSSLVALKPGDLIFTGTPAGVAPLQRGDTCIAELEAIARLECHIA